MPAVPKNLSIDLLQKDSTSRGHPAFAGRELREGLAHDIRSQRFTREVRVRTEVIREVMFDVRELPIDSDEGVDEPGLRVGEQEMNRHRPRDSSKADLEHARPVDAGERRIRVNPALHLIDDRAGIAGLAGQPRRTAKLQPMLMTVQLPDDLVIADRGIEIRDIRPADARRMSIVYGIEMPVDDRLVSARAPRR